MISKRPYVTLTLCTILGLNSGVIANAQEVQVPSNPRVRDHSHQVTNPVARMFTVDAIPNWIQAAITGYLGFKVVNNMLGNEVLMDNDHPGQKATYSELSRRLSEEIARNKSYLDRQQQILYPSTDMQFEGPMVVSSLRVHINPPPGMASAQELELPSATSQPVSETQIKRIMKMAEAPDYQLLVIEDLAERKSHMFRMRPAGTLLEHSVPAAELQRLEVYLNTKIGQTSSLIASFENYTTDRFATSDGITRMPTNTLNLAEVTQKVDGAKARSEYLRGTNANRRFQYLGGIVLANVLILAYQHRYELAALGQDGIQDLENSMRRQDNDPRNQQRY